MRCGLTALAAAAAITCVCCSAWAQLGAYSGSTGPRTIGPLTDDYLGTGSTPLGTYGNLSPFGFFPSGQEKPDKLTARGNTGVSFTMNRVSGGTDTYHNQFWDTNPVTTSANLFVLGPLLGRLSVNGAVSSTQLTRTVSSWALTYDLGPGDLTFGDNIDARVQGNSFLYFQQRRQGLAIASERNARVPFKFFISENKGEVRRESFAGNDSPGPYRLHYSPILDGSEIVKVDEVVMRRGVDYVIDYYGGWLTFEVDFGDQHNRRIVPPTSIIAVSYESAQSLNRAGTIYGFDTSVPMGSKFNMTLGMLAQTTQHGLSTEPQSILRVEEFPGAGSVGPFRLRYAPIDITRPVLVYVDGLLRQENVDYEFIPESGVILFRNIIPPGALVRVEYYQRSDASDITDLGAGNRVIGVSGTWTPAKNANLLAEYARSSAPGGTPGSALRLLGSTQLDKGKFQLDAETSNVSPTFRRFQGIGFERNRKGTAVSAKYEPIPGIRAQFTTSKDRSDQGLLFGGGVGSPSSLSQTSADLNQTTGDQTSTFAYETSQTSYGVSTSFKRWPTLSLTRRSFSNDSGTSTSDYDQDSLSVRYALGGVAVSARDSKTRQATASIVSGSEPTYYASHTRNRQYGISYNPSSNFGISADLATADSLYASGSSSDGKTTTLNARWSPGRAWQITAQQSRYRATGSAYSSSYAAPLQTSGGDSNTYQDSRTGLGLAWTPSTRFWLNVGLNRSRYQSGLTAGYTGDHTSSDLSWAFGGQLGTFALAGSVGNSAFDYLGTGAGRLGTKTTAFNLNYLGNTRFRMGMDYTRILTTSPSSGFFSGGDTTMSSLGARFGYRLTDKTGLDSVLQWASTSGAFDDSRKFQFISEYSYRISQDFSAGLRFRHVNYNSQREPVGGFSASDYRANTLSLNLSLLFD